MRPDDHLIVQCGPFREPVAGVISVFAAELRGWERRPVHGWEVRGLSSSTNQKSHNSPPGQTDSGRGNRLFVLG